MESTPPRKRRMTASAMGHTTTHTSCGSLPYAVLSSRDLFLSVTSFLAGVPVGCATQICQYRHQIPSIRDHKARFKAKKKEWAARVELDGWLQYVAAWFGDLQLLQFMHTSGVERYALAEALGWYSHFCTELAVIAAEDGHLDVGEWLGEAIGRSCWSAERCAGPAIFYGHMHVARYFIDRGYQCTEDDADNAVFAGHPEIVRWLMVDQQVSCSEQAVDDAGSCGHVDVVQYLWEYQRDVTAVYKAVTGQLFYSMQGEKQWRVLEYLVSAGIHKYCLWPFDYKSLCDPVPADFYTPDHKTLFEIVLPVCSTTVVLMEVIRAGEAPATDFAEFVLDQSPGQPATAALYVEERKKQLSGQETKNAVLQMTADAISDVDEVEGALPMATEAAVRTALLQALFHQKQRDHEGVVQSILAYERKRPQCGFLDVEFLEECLLLPFKWSEHIKVCMQEAVASIQAV